MLETLIRHSVWLQSALGVPPDKTDAQSQGHLIFPAAWTALAIALLLGASFAWFGGNYWFDGSRPKWTLKSLLLGLRLLAVYALVLLLSQPTYRRNLSDKVRPNVVIMVDNSESMAIADPKLPANRARIEAQAAGVSAGEAGKMTRLERINAALNQSKALTALSKKYNVHLYGFASKPEAIALPSDLKKRAAYQFNVAPDVKTGDSTQIGTALQRPLDDLAGQPIAGALVLSDGGSNLGSDPITAADNARQSRMAVSAMGFGDPTKTKDVALLSVLADNVVRTNNTVSVFAALSHRGYRGKTVTVTLQRNGEVIGRETVKLGADEQKQEIKFNYVPTRAGKFYYAVSVTGLPGEVTLANNKRTFSQVVISKKLKVLYVENEPRYEYRYLNKAILRDKSLDFACLLLNAAELSEGNLEIHQFPQTDKELFQYDIVVLGDVPRSAFSDAQLEFLRRFVEGRGGSLLVIAGEDHMPQDYAGTPLEAVLPVVIGGSPDPLRSEEPFQWQRTPEGKRSPIMQLEDNSADNEAAWESLRGMLWAAGVPRAKPGATVLAVHPTRRNADGPYPIVAVQPFGAGRCFIELVDSTWLWRWRVGDRYFYRYWGQVFRALTPKEIPGDSRLVQLNADRSSYRLGEKVQLYAGLLDENYYPLKAEKAGNPVAVITYQNGVKQNVPMRAVPGSAGSFSAEATPDRVGRYEVSLTSPANANAKATADYTVESLALEKQKPELDEPALRKIAAAGGGKYYQPNELAKWIASLPDNGLTVKSETETEIWDRWPLLVLFLTPLALEWLLRKRTGLL